MVCNKPVIGKSYPTVFIIDRRTIERITHCLSPMLIAGINVMVVIVVVSAYMVGNGLCVVVIDWTALILGVDIL